MQHVKNIKSLPQKQQGFTLLELLIASIIFAIMAVMAYGGLDNVIRNSESSQQALKRLQQIQQSVSVLNRDFSQIVPRSIRDEFGNLQPYLSAGSNIDLTMKNWFACNGHRWIAPRKQKLKKPPLSIT